MVVKRMSAGRKTRVFERVKVLHIRIKYDEVNPLGVAISCIVPGLAIGEDFQPQSNQGVISTKSRDERGCVNGEVVEDLCVSYSDFLNKRVVSKVKRPWQT